jgi:hypothetical protein
LTFVGALQQLDVETETTFPAVVVVMVAIPALELLALVVVLVAVIAIFSRWILSPACWTVFLEPFRSNSHPLVWHN